MTFSSLYRQTDRQYDDRARILDSEFALYIISSFLLMRKLIFTFSDIYKISCEFLLFRGDKVEVEIAVLASSELNSAKAMKLKCSLQS